MFSFSSFCFNSLPPCFLFSVILPLPIPPALSKMLPQIFESFFVLCFYSKIWRVLCKDCGQSMDKKKTLHPKIPSHPHAKRPHRLYSTTNPRWYLVFSGQRNREKIEAQALDPSPGHGNGKVPGEEQ